MLFENACKWGLIADPPSPSTLQPTSQAKQDRTRWANRQIGLLLKGSWHFPSGLANAINAQA